VDHDLLGFLFWYKKDSNLWKTVFDVRNLKDCYRIYHSQQKLSKENTIFWSQQFCGSLSLIFLGNQAGGGQKKDFFLKKGERNGKIWGKRLRVLAKPPKKKFRRRKDSLPWLTGEESRSYRRKVWGLISLNSSDTCRRVFSSVQNILSHTTYPAFKNVSSSVSCVTQPTFPSCPPPVRPTRLWTDWLTPGFLSIKRYLLKVFSILDW
jgi:hypothetical protein